ncbi:MAG: hypothetical protein M1501_03715 [Candidatus Omnitrophica bacterium]|nr:hypothetical protein [Candidatus Omnitrophota bacterium]
MHFKIEPSNRWCHIHPGFISKFVAIHDITDEREVESGFTLMHTTLPAFEQTLFKVYRTRQNLIVVVMIVDKINKFDLDDRIEIYFDCNHDHIGFYQFIFSPETKPLVYTHQPYAEAGSTAFRWLDIHKYRWLSPMSDNVIGQNEHGPCLFAWFPIKDVFRNDDCCGFNVTRWNHRLKESQSWNRFTGNLLQDASGFGHLYAGKSPARCILKTAMIKNGCLQLTGAWNSPRMPAEFTIELCGPDNNRIFLKIQRKGNCFESRGGTINIPGRYRIYVRAKKQMVEPDFWFFDVTPVEPYQKRRFRLAMTYDIPDNIRFNSFTPKRLDASFAQIEQCGIQRIYWIDYPQYTDFPTFWNFASDGRYARETFRACGDILNMAVNLSQKRNLEFIGIFKPFDLGFTGPYPHKLRIGRNSTARGLVKRIDNRFDVALPQIAQHPEWTMSSHPNWMQTFNLPVTKLTFRSERPIARVQPGEIQIWTSTDNQKYLPYTGPCHLVQGERRELNMAWTPAGLRTEPGSHRVWFIELSKLRVTTPFIAVNFVNNQIRLVNRRFAIITAKNKNDVNVPVSFAPGRNIRDGFVMNSPWSWQNYTEEIIDKTDWTCGVVGIVMTERPGLTTVLEPAFPEARTLWLNHVDRLLKAGVDGIDIRTLCHHNTTTSWLQFAFAEPVRRRFRELYNREIEPTPADYQRIRRIRGECYSEFIRIASEHTRRHGKKFGVHIEPGNEVPDTMQTRMAMTIEWERWITEGWLDELTLKYWSPQSSFVHERILPLAKKAGLTVFYSESNNALNVPRAIELAENMVRSAVRAGLNGFTFYEEASYFRMNPSGVSWPVGLANHAIRRVANRLNIY